MSLRIQQHKRRKSLQFPNTRAIEVIVEIEVLEDADIQEVISEMDYKFEHPMIVGTEIRDVFTDL